ncbi:iron ABC transporter permease [uncultured Corynebacterium sp.]|uniref:FecCD family ABC transporter permease n=1 Tax=uncultured Corynebacterium sp. TaxID=159447 RepID=UPI0025922251|nr:iron ABC transporter permease [uncultured Corynebacterium sp.]
MTAVQSHISATFLNRKKKRGLLFAALIVLLVLVTMLSISLGQFTIPLSQLTGILAKGPMGASTLDETVVWRIRIPRVLLGLLVGAALGVAGALMQAVFANPLAEPSVIGVTSGAGVGAAFVMVTGWTVLGSSTVPVAAFIAAMLTAVLVYSLSRMNGQVRIVNLILVGIAVNAVAGAIISFMVFIAPTSSREQIIFWQMGSLNAAKWEQVSTVAIVVGLGIAASLFMVNKLDVLALGDRAAGHVGVDVQKLRLAAIALATLLTAGAVSYAGLIGFVGLIVPHIIRTVSGPANRILIPASALGGALLIAGADIVARTAVEFADLPIGIFTALVGGPTFFILLRRMMKRGGLK